MTDLPSLHPQRIAAALENLLRLRAELTDADLDTCRAALRQIQRAQQAIGFTSDVADMGRGLIQTVGSLSKLVRKRL